MAELDPRIHAYRPDLAATELKGRVEAESFTDGNSAQVRVGRLPLRGRPDFDASMTSELLFGERVTIYEDRDGWAWLQNEADDYVGYAESHGLTPVTKTPTHRVEALRSFIYPRPDLKSPPIDLVSIASLVTVNADNGQFSWLAGGGWIFTHHLTAIDRFRPSWQHVALEFVGTPYLWGGRSSIGLDCSALIQLSLACCGIKAPRDSDQQAARIGKPVTWDDEQDALQSGDLVFWPGHVGIWIDREQFIHANATDMMVAVGALPEIASRIERQTGDKVACVRRPDYKTRDTAP